MRIIGVDPGPRESGVVLLDGDLVRVARADMPNDDVRPWMTDRLLHDGIALVALESFRMYGVRGEECRDTLIWTGRFVERTVQRGVPFELLYRDDVKAAMCPGCPRAKDKDVRAAIVDMYGGKKAAAGTTKEPGPLRNVSGHAWAALAVALVAKDRMETASSSRGISPALRCDTA